MAKRAELGTRIRVEEVERFQRDYVYGRDIAGAFHTSSRKIARLLAEQGIFPIRGHTAVPPRMLIYRVTEELRRFIVTSGGDHPPGFQLIS
jgi:hypothetical protein